MKTRKGNRSVTGAARRLRALFHGILTLGGGGLLGLPCWSGPHYMLQVQRYNLTRHQQYPGADTTEAVARLCSSICGKGVTECEMAVQKENTLHTTCFQTIGWLASSTREPSTGISTTDALGNRIEQPAERIDVPPEGMPCPSDKTRGESCMLKPENDAVVAEWQLTRTYTPTDIAALCMPACPPKTTSCFLWKGPKGPGELSCERTETVFEGAGRRPPGLCAVNKPLSVGAYLAGAAGMEAAAVTAFRVLRGELRRFGAPRGLLRGASRAAREEVRHARSMGALARRKGHRPEALRIEKTPPRSLFSLAIDNAVEGCVRETYGALVATYQAATAKDWHVREAMSRIAQDETRHAALSWEIAAWIERRLSPDERARLREAQETALLNLAGDAAREPSSPFATELGLPTSAVAQRLAEELSKRLFPPLETAPA